MQPAPGRHGRLQLPPPVIRQPGEMQPAVPLRAPGPDPVPYEAAPAPRPPVGKSDYEELFPEGPIPERPPRDTAPRTPKPGDVRIAAEVMQSGAAYEGVTPLILIGTPVIERAAHRANSGSPVPALEIRANVMVAWIDGEGAPIVNAMGGGDGLRLGGQGNAAAPSREGRREASVVPAFLRGVYAEGAVWLRWGDLSFKAEALYIDPNGYKGVLVEPRVDGAIGPEVAPVDQRIPIHIRAERARLLSRGLTRFDQGELAISRANDRFALQVKTLTVEEIGEVLDENGNPVPNFLGYQSLASQRIRATDVGVRGEGVPLFRLPSLEFETSQGIQELPTGFRRLDVGRRNETGIRFLLSYGRPVEDARGDTLFDWTVTGGGYSARGPAGGLTLTWDRDGTGMGPRGKGRLETFGMYDADPVDQDGFRAPNWRGFVKLESRTWLSTWAWADVEWNAFSDRGYNFEYFESDEIQHKDRESYVRLQARPPSAPGVAATATAKWHQRPFVTETTELPALGLWGTSIPIVTPRRRGGVGIDLIGDAGVGRYARRFDEDLGLPDYEADRGHADVRLGIGVNAGDVRLSGFVGPSVVSYWDRDDGGEDLTRSALVAQAQMNLQLSRRYGRCGTWLQLDGLRHVIDSDLGIRGRFLDSHDPSEVPFFDRRDERYEHSTLYFRLRNRLETRRRAWRNGRMVDKKFLSRAERKDFEAGGAIRTVLDLETDLLYYLDGRDPLGRETDGAFEIRAIAEPRPFYTVQGELLVDFERGVDQGFLAAGFKTREDRRWLEGAAAVRYVDGFGFSISGQLRYRWSEKYALEISDTIDARDDRNTFRFILSRFSEDHRWDLGFSYRDSLSLEVNFRPLIGDQSERSGLFDREEVRRDPFGLFRRQIE